MPRLTPSLLRQTALAAGALALLSVAVPAASAAPQGDRIANKSRVVKTAQSKRDHTKSKTSPHRREYRRDNGADTRREGRSSTRSTDRRSDRSTNHRSHRDNNSRHTRYSPPRRYTPRYTPAPRYSSNRGHRSSYRSGLGISFHLGSPGYSQFRWASSPHSFYRSSYGHYGSYQRRTSCRRVTIDGWHHGHREQVSVMQCSNPWDGTYIVQGSEQVIACRW